MIDKIEELQETLMMIEILIDQIDAFYSVNSTLIRDVQPDSAKFVLEKAATLLTASLIKEVLKDDQKRKVICGIKEYDRKPIKSHGEIFFHCVTSTLIFDSYEGFENYKRMIALENADQSRKTATLIEWWWWYDQA